MANQNNNKSESNLTISTESFNPLLKDLKNTDNQSDNFSTSQNIQPQQSDTNSSNQNSEDNPNDEV
ncbi:hypothetical protein [Helicobacter sp. 10-6591]|uniref:hypothetical protein n=1 Tax=Helicobacter sp. 10-6591 TaxID=2004998 RepID=UPI000DCC70EC|nr:hypothetical protein [Helicobacter sp. 10-6591]RAX54779.1 hypothetical protein CCY97_05230 [Helicobacter sp. 10-6591]